MTHIGHHLRTGRHFLLAGKIGKREKEKGKKEEAVCYDKRSLLLIVKEEGSRYKGIKSQVMMGRNSVIDYNCQVTFLSQE